MICVFSSCYLGCFLTLLGVIFEVIGAQLRKSKDENHGAKHSSLSLEVMVALRARFSCLKISSNFDNVLSNQIEFDSILKQFDTIAF